MARIAPLNPPYAPDIQAASRRCAGDERDRLVRQPRAGRVPESRTLQEVAAHTRIAKRASRLRLPSTRTSRSRPAAAFISARLCVGVRSAIADASRYRKHGNTVLVALGLDRRRRR
jgi:hypothetical protein